MNRALLLTTLAAGSALAGSPEALLTAKPQPKDWVEAVKQALVVYENKDTFITKVALTTRQQWQMASVQPNAANGGSLKQGATTYNDEFRRNWIGANVYTRTGTQFHTYVRIGGLPIRDTYSAGRTRKNYSYTGFYDIWLKQSIGAVKGLKSAMAHGRIAIAMVRRAANRAENNVIFIKKIGFANRAGFALNLISHFITAFRGQHVPSIYGISNP